MRAIVLFGALALVLGTPGLLFAAEENGNLLTPRLDLGLWSLVVFVLLFIVLGKFAWGPMLHGLQRREQNIRSAIEEAQKTREEAQKLRTQFEQQLAKAHENVRDILDEGRRAAQRLTEEMTSKARADIQAEHERRRREIEMAKDQALQELWNQSAQLATLISAKAIRRQLNEEDHRRLVDEALAELRHAGTEWQQQGTGVRT
jgi:F-type H+-transporting ATPase subunit b